MINSPDWTEYEIDYDKFYATAPFYVYKHHRPDGRVFYIGKGTKRRAYDFAPTRRTKHHQNIVKKYGRENITITLIPCAFEGAAFAVEKAHIAAGDRSQLANLTDGGEGCSGRKPTEKQLAGLAKGRYKGKKMSESAKAAWIPRFIEISNNWKNTLDGKEHLRLLSGYGRANLHKEREASCVECHKKFMTRSAKARNCSRLCEQRNRRRREKTLGNT